MLSGSPEVGAQLITFDVAFTESVTGFTAASDIDCSFGSPSVTGHVVNAPTGSGMNYQFTVNLVDSADGQLICRVIAGAASDAAGNGNVVSPDSAPTFFRSEIIAARTLNWIVLVILQTRRPRSSHAHSWKRAPATTELCSFRRLSARLSTESAGMAWTVLLAHYPFRWNASTSTAAHGALLDRSTGCSTWSKVVFRT